MSEEKGLTLYNISQETQDVLYGICLAEGEITEEEEQKLKILDEKGISEYESKRKVLKWMLSNIDIMKAEEDRIKQQRQVVANGVERLKKYLIVCMDMAEKKKVTLETGSFAIRDNAPSVEITDENLIPEEYLEFPAPKPIKNAIKDALKKGKEVPGAKLINSRTLQIK